jgi:hypothetical protein
MAQEIGIFNESKPAAVLFVTKIGLGVEDRKNKIIDKWGATPKRFQRRIKHFTLW